MPPIDRPGPSRAPEPPTAPQLTGPGVPVPPEQLGSPRAVSPPSGSPRLGRRGVLAAGAVVALAPAAGCTVFSSSRTTRTSTVAAPPPTDPMDNLISMTRLHYLRLQAGAGLGGSAGKLAPLAKDRLEHLKRLLGEQARTNRSTPAPATEPGQSVAAPASTAAAISSAVEDASIAQVAFTDQIPNVSRYRAALFASIAACLATHRTVLAPS